jgi:succinyl-diaminopimelate desuccinylase
MKFSIDVKEAQTLTADLVRIPSPYFQEEPVMRFAFDWLEKAKVPVEFHRFHEDKILNYEGINVWGVVEGAKSGPTVVLNGHLDTVKLCEGWTRDPFGAEVEDGRLYGLGACDMKGGCASIMLALKHFLMRNGSFSGRIVYSLVCDEEGPFGLGTDALIMDGIIPQKADIAIVTEPSSAFAGVVFPAVCLGARGGYNYKLSFTGKSAHGAFPEQGINAVSDAAKVLLELEKTSMRFDEKLGRGSICCIDFEGGGAALSVPDRAEFSVFRHTVLGEDKDTILEEVKAAVERANIRSKVDFKFREAPHPECDGFPAYVTSRDNEYVNLFEESTKHVTGQSPKETYFASVGDFCYLGGRLGIPTIVFGPSGGNFHGPDEYVNIEDVKTTTEVILEFLERSLNLSMSSPPHGKAYLKEMEL